MAKSKIVKANEKVAEKVAGTYKKVENAVVDGYKKVEDTVVAVIQKLRINSLTNISQKTEKPLKKRK